MLLYTSGRAKEKNERPKQIKIKNEISLEENRKAAFEKLLEYSLSNESITDDLVDKIIKDLSV